MISASGDLWEAVEEEHEWFGGVSSRDIVELDPISSHIPMSTQTGIQQARRRNYTYHSIGREREREREGWKGRGHTHKCSLSLAVFLSAVKGLHRRVTNTRRRPKEAHRHMKKQPTTGKKQVTKPMFVRQLFKVAVSADLLRMSVSDN